MRGIPSNDAREAPPTPSLPVKPRAQASGRTLSSRFAKPAVLMDATDAPKLAKGEAIRAQRDAFRAFMTRHGLRPTEWANQAGVAPGEILGFLTGQSRSIAPATLEKLAAVAKVSSKDILG
jgi:hypothetical protein